MRTPIEKAAILLISLGEDLAADILRQLNPAEASYLLDAMKRVGRVDAATADAILKEFATLLQNSPSKQLPQGQEFAKKLLHKSLGEDQANQLLVPAPLAESLRLAELADDKSLFDILQREKPQTIAVILAHLTAKKSSRMLALFPKSMQVETILRMARLDQINAEMLAEIDSVLTEALTKLKHKGSSKAGGVKKVADILAYLGQAKGQELLEAIDERNSDLSASIKAALFTFEDLQRLDNRSLQTLLQKFSQDDWALAFRKVSPALLQRFMSNLSDRASRQMQDNIANAKPVPLSKVEEKQREIVKLAAALIAKGELNDPAAEVV